MCFNNIVLYCQANNFFKERIKIEKNDLRKIEHNCRKIMMKKDLKNLIDLEI